MAGYKEPMTASSHFQYDEETALPVTEFFRTYKNKLPMLAIIVDGIYGLTRYDSFDCNQVIRMHCYTSQPRVLCMKESDARMLDSKFVSIPVLTDIRFRVIKSRKNVTDPLPLKTILESYAIPLLIKPEPSDSQRTVKVRSQSYPIHDFGNILIMDKYVDHYFKQNCIDGKELKMNTVACMLGLNDEITVAPITGLSERSEKEFEKFRHQLDKQASMNLQQYNWTDYQFDPQSQIGSGPTFPVPMNPTEALQMIQTFLAEPLPPLPPSGTSSRKPMRPVPPPKQLSPDSANHIQTPDEEDNGDYELVEDNTFRPPALPSRTPIADTRSDRPKSPRRLAPLSGTNINTTRPQVVKPTPNRRSKRNIETKSENKNNEGKKTSVNVAAKPTDLELHARESGKKDGYSNTNIGRAVVRPQLKLPPEETYDDAMSECDLTEKRHQVDHTRKPSVQEDEAEDIYYIAMADVEMPPLPLPPKRDTPDRHTETTSTVPSDNSDNTISPVQGDVTTFPGVKELSIDEVSAVLTQLNLEQFTNVFRKNCIDGEILSELTVTDFVAELKLTKLQAIRLHKYVSTGHIPK